MRRPNIGKVTCRISTIAFYILHAITIDYPSIRTNMSKMHVSTVQYCIVERTQTDYASGLAAYSNNNCFIALLFLPLEICNGDLPLEFFTLASAPCSRRSRAISNDRKRVARCNGVSCSLFCAFTSAPRSSKRCARRTLPGWLDRDHDLFLRCT